MNPPKPCPKFTKLLQESLDNLNDVDKRHALMLHPASCSHPTCMQVTELWSRIID